MNHDWVTVREHDHPADAEWDAVYLREFGIEVSVHDPGADEHEPDFDALVEVRVATADIGRARDLLAANENLPEPDDVPDEEADPPDPDEVPPEPPSERTKTLERAFGFAQFGCIFPPFLIVSVWLMGAAFRKSGQLDTTGRYCFLVTGCLNLFAGLVWCRVILSVFR